MLKILTLFGILLLSHTAIAQKNEAGFQELYNNGIISISAEKILYESEFSEHFFVHYQIKNITQKFTLYPYLKEYSLNFYPNQWGIVDTTARMIIDERRIIPGLNDSIIKRMEILIYSKPFSIQPGKTLDYYRDFNNGNKKDIPLKQGEYLYVSMDGQLAYYINEHVHDSEFEYLPACAHFEDEKNARECSVYFPFPLTFKKIPLNSIVFYEN